MEELLRIDREISELKSSLENIRGRETEVYTRIVGYYRSVRNWNPGKKDEYGKRKVFKSAALTAGQNRKAASGV